MKQIKYTVLSFLSLSLMSASIFAQIPAPKTGRSRNVAQIAITQSDQFYPTSIVLLDQYFSHHVLIAEKETHTLYLFENRNNRPFLIKAFKMASGKVAGDKSQQGDHRTPEGVYQLEAFIPHNELLRRYGKEGKIYGVGAFSMDYPNAIDKKRSKTGSGIWLHSTNDETRIDLGLDSRGCVVTANNDLKDISTFIEISKTPIVVVNQLNYLPAAQWLKRQEKVRALIDSWSEAWRNEDLNAYIEAYHPQEYFGTLRSNREQLRAYKKAVFNNPGKPSVNIHHVSVLEGTDYMRVQLIQDYKATTLSDVGLKTLYLKGDNEYNPKIIYEQFSKWQGSLEQIAQFTPSMRFFPDSPTQGLEAGEQSANQLQEL
jgi:uncharacterized protein (TIGR02246 family)